MSVSLESYTLGGPNEVVVMKYIVWRFPPADRC